ncbi:MAG: hypothetical protein ABIK31_03895 [candidate division WOR-3 bacterium]
MYKIDIDSCLKPIYRNRLLKNKFYCGHYIIFYYRGNDSAKIRVISRNTKELLFQYTIVLTKQSFRIYKTEYRVIKSTQKYYVQQLKQTELSLVLNWILYLSYENNISEVKRQIIFKIYHELKSFSLSRTECPDIFSFTQSVRLKSFEKTDFMRAYTLLKKRFKISAKNLIWIYRTEKKNDPKIIWEFLLKVSTWNGKLGGVSYLIHRKNRSIYDLHFELLRVFLDNMQNTLFKNYFLKYIREEHPQNLIRFIYALECYINFYGDFLQSLPELIQELNLQLLYLLNKKKSYTGFYDLIQVFSEHPRFVSDLYSMIIEFENEGYKIPKVEKFKKTHDFLLKVLTHKKIDKFHCLMNSSDNHYIVPDITFNVNDISFSIPKHRKELLLAGLCTKTCIGSNSQYHDSLKSFLTTCKSFPLLGRNQDNLITRCVEVVYHDNKFEIIQNVTTLNKPCNDSEEILVKLYELKHVFDKFLIERDNNPLRMIAD